ncbi:MAG: transposase [Pseudanabaenales cyanobacterium]|nr:transposase [Pseudanabaenales cyanobacterium]
MLSLEAQVNAALQSRAPSKIINHRHRLAIDLHLIPYYGEPTQQSAPYIYRSKAKAGTTSFFAYATVYVIRPHQRFTLAMHAVPHRETSVATITYLLDKLTPLRVKVKRLYLDRGFYSVPVIRWLKALKLPFIMPAVIRGKQGGARALCQGRKSYTTQYALKSAVYGSVDCQMAIICRYYKGIRGRHGIQYLIYVVYRVKVALHQVHHHYRDRFGIETSYRIKNQCRIRTTTKNPVLRLLFVALAFILVNLWIYLLWRFVSITRQGGRRVYQQRFRLKTMLEFLSHAIERHFPVIHEVYLPSSQ